MLREFYETLHKFHSDGEINYANMTIINKIWTGLLKKTSYSGKGRYSAADKGVLKTVYRKLAKVYHSDVIHDDEPMKFINELKQHWGW